MSDERRTIDKLRLVNFTAFIDLTMEFSPGINAIIGENATGKTQLLKAIYLMRDLRDISTPFGFIRDLHSIDIHSSHDLQNWGDINELANRKGEKNWSLKIHVGDESNWIRTHPIKKHEYESFNIENAITEKQFKNVFAMVFFPEKNMLPHAKGLRSIKKKFNIQLDSSDLDILDSAFLVPFESISPAAKSLMNSISAIIDGELETTRDDEVSVRHKDYVLPIKYEAEGHSKFYLLWLLLRNGEFQPGSVLLWDEPEANLNPKLIKEIVKIMLQLEQMGVQIFFTTHDYVVLKWLDLLAEEKHKVRYHALYRDEESEIKCESKATLVELQQNAILDVYEDLYNTELKRTIDRIGDDEG